MNKTEEQKRNGWRLCILAAEEATISLDLLTEILYQQEEAKNILRNKGYGCTGMDIVLTAKEVPAAKE